MKGTLGHALPSQQTALGRGRLVFSQGASLRCRRRNGIAVVAARTQSGADGRDPLQSSSSSSNSDSIDAEWQKVRMQPLWQNLNAELDRCWAARSFTEEAEPSVDESWDTSSETSDSFASSGASPLERFSGLGSVDTLWPSAARTAYSSASGPQSWLQELPQVYVILFGVGSTDTEGIYSLRVMSRDDGLPQDTIIAFSSKEDAERYAGLLEATMEHVPSVCPIEPVELLDFCTDSGYSYRVESAGSLLIPPDYYVGITDWERSLRLREGKWTVVDRDQPAPSSPAADATLPQHPSPAEPHMSNNANFYPLSDSSYLLQEARARLERLLPNDC